MNRLKNNKSLLIAVILLLLLLVFVVLQSNFVPHEDKARKHVSMIVYGDDPERWENMRQGAGLVCGEKNADLSLITMMSENDIQEQKDIIDREIADGADALIIAACDSVGIKEYLKEKKLRIPVSFVETAGELAMSFENVYCAAPDDYGMGYELGQSLLENESDIVTVAIISENTQRESVSLREQGLRDAIEDSVGKIINWSRNDHEKNAGTRMFIQRALVSEATDVIVTFDNPTTDALLDALNNLNATSRIYCISTSDKAVYNLHSEEIKVLGYPDEYSMGYLAAMYALDRSEAWKKYRDTKIEYRLVMKENMYDEDNQTLLFPFAN